jgi:hypothetical protein
MAFAAIIALHHCATEIASAGKAVTSAPATARKEARLSQLTPSRTGRLRSSALAVTGEKAPAPGPAPTELVDDRHFGPFGALRHRHHGLFERAGVEHASARKVAPNLAEPGYSDAATLTCPTLTHDYTQDSPTTLFAAMDVKSGSLVRMNGSFRQACRCS